MRMLTNPNQMCTPIFFEIKTEYFWVLTLVCDKHETTGLQISVCGLSPQGAKFFFPVGSKLFGENFGSEEYFEMVKSVIF